MGRNFKHRKVAIAILASLMTGAVALPLIASEAFYKDKSRGWFWKEKQPLPSEPPPPPLVELPIGGVAPTKEASADPKEPPTFSVKWFQQNYMSIFESAVDNPTPANMDKFRVVTRVMMDKASNATQLFRERAALDTDLDEQNRYPIASVMRSQMGTNINENTDTNLRYLSDKAFFWVFLDEECNFCGIQYSIINDLVKKTGLQVSYIVKQGKPIFGMNENDDVLPDVGHSENLNLKLTPSIVMVVPPQKFVVLTQGMLSADLLSERILLAAKSEGLLDNFRYAQTNPNVAGLLNPNQIKAMGNLDIKGADFDTRVREALRENVEQINAVRKKATHTVASKGSN